MKAKEVIVTEEELPAEVLRAIGQGRKLEAIKLLREATGLGLANAKVLVEKAARTQHPGQSMPRMVDEESSLGTLLKMLVLAAVAFALYRYFVGA